MAAREGDGSSWRRRLAPAAPWIRWVSAGLILGALFLLARALPVERAIHALQGWLDRLGPAAPLLYGCLYAVATVLLFPGSVLTLAAGLFFGLWWGTVTASLAATTGAALAFLVARHGARQAVARRVRRHPRARAVDQAVADGGWRIVALLRLSPAIPFNLQNYLYGLTAIGFWPAILTSWVAMLPGTFLYVYLGYLSREGLEAAGRAGTDLGRWILLGLGLAATLVLTVYLTRLARRRIARRTGIGGEEDEEDGKEPAGGKKEGKVQFGRTALLAVSALAMAAAAACATLYGERLAGLFGPPPVEMEEAYGKRPEGPGFDHGPFDRLLERHVDEAGWVDYRSLREDEAELDRYLGALAGAPFARMGRDGKLALLVNAYNAFTLKLILEHWNGGELSSIRDIPAGQRWKDPRWEIGGHTWSLDQIEHEQIRSRFVEPRIHFALVCAAADCPPLRREAYTPKRMERQLAAQARYVHDHPTWFRFDPAEAVLHLTRIYKWYRGDFTQVAGSVPAYAARHSPALKKALAGGRRPRSEWLDYDWTLNSKENRRPR